MSIQGLPKISRHTRGGYVCTSDTAEAYGESRTEAFLNWQRIKRTGLPASTTPVQEAALPAKDALDSRDVFFANHNPRAKHW